MNEAIPYHIIAIVEEPVKIGLLRTNEFKSALRKTSYIKERSDMFSDILRKKIDNKIQDCK